VRYRRAGDRCAGGNGRDYGRVSRGRFDQFLALDPYKA
jgi:hypothetical protein